MAELFFCTVSSVNYENITVDVAIPEREDAIKTEVPILDTVYRIPEPGETVVALFDEVNGRLQRGVIIGRPYYQLNTMEISAKTVRINKLEAESIIYQDSCRKG